MERFELLKQVTVGLQNCRTANNVGLEEHFTIAEIADFANTLLHYLPDNYNDKFRQVDEGVLNMIADKKVFLWRLQVQYVKKLYIKMLQFDDNVDKELHHIIFLAIIMLKEGYDKEPDDTLNDIVNYYESLLLESGDLAKNVHEMLSIGAVAEFDNKGNYLRVNYEEHELVPTITTKENFNNLII